MRPLIISEATLRQLDHLAAVQGGANAIAPQDIHSNEPIQVQIVEYDERLHQLRCTSDRWTGVRVVDPFVSGALSIDSQRHRFGNLLVGRTFTMEPRVQYACGAYLPKHFTPSKEAQHENI